MTAVTAVTAVFSRKPPSFLPPLFYEKGKKSAVTAVTAATPASLETRNRPGKPRGCVRAAGWGSTEGSDGHDTGD
jgi:hypothetical protein